MGDHVKSCCNNSVSVKEQGTPRFSFMATLDRWRSNVHSRRTLARLDQRLLRDCGITEAERQAELAKPFWR